MFTLWISPAVKSWYNFCFMSKIFSARTENTGFVCMDAVFVEQQTGVTKNFIFCFTAIVPTTYRTQNYFDWDSRHIEFSFMLQKAAKRSQKSKQINNEREPWWITLTIASLLNFINKFDPESWQKCSIHLGFSFDLFLENKRHWLGRIIALFTSFAARFFTGPSWSRKQAYVGQVLLC